MEVKLTREAREQFDDLPLSVKGRVASVFARLVNYPAVSGAKPLRGDLAGRYRIRTGDYRVQFHIDQPDTVVVEKVGHRDGFYDE
jgi:mRNA interferase RelE/StbE